jgi:hypothetical protein
VITLKTIALLGAGISLACCTARTPAPEVPTPPGAIAFGLFGDAPYLDNEEAPYRRVLADIGQSDVQFLIHVGDLFRYSCTDAHLLERRREMDAVTHPVIYIPGDNEWTDCYRKKSGSFAPLERLQTIRRLMFADPTLSRGAPRLALASQGSIASYAEFVEHARWRRGALVFATLHVVGSGNATEPFDTRTTANDEEVVRRTAAAIAWLDTTFAIARDSGAKAVVLALHADMGIGKRMMPGSAYVGFLTALRTHVERFPGEVILLHGDSHKQRMDHPLTNERGEVLRRFTRIETFGSPEVGWVRIVMDTTTGALLQVYPRQMKGAF